jgi:hypothetical protein
MKTTEGDDGRLYSAVLLSVSSIQETGFGPLVPVRKIA